MRRITKLAYRREHARKFLSPETEAAAGGERYEVVLGSDLRFAGHRVLESRN